MAVGVPKSTLWLIIEEMNKIFSDLAQFLIKLPDIDELPALNTGLMGENGRHKYVLVMDGAHVEMEAPKTRKAPYVNRKGRYSVNYLCVVDHKKRIRADFCHIWGIPCIGR